jgi:hypothetical protein
MFSRAAPATGASTPCVKPSAGAELMLDALGKVAKAGTKFEAEAEILVSAPPLFRRFRRDSPTVPDIAAMMVFGHACPENGYRLGACSSAPSSQSEMLEPPRYS